MKARQFLLSAGVIVFVGVVFASVYAAKRLKSGGPPDGGGYEPAEAVEAVTARSVTWQPTADLVGTVFALRSVTLSNEVAGTVTEVAFESGQVVEPGQVLLTLDSRTEQAELEAALASIRAAESNRAMVESDISLADSNLRRMRQAVESNAAPKMDVDQAEASLTSSKANLLRMSAEIDAAKARVEQIRSVIAKKSLKAPFKARAGIRNVHPGQYLQEGAEIVRLESIDDRIYIDFALPQEHLARVKPGDSVMAKSSVLGDEPIRIEVVALDAAANRETRNVRLRSIVDNTAQRLRPGMFVDVRVPVGPEQTFVAIPATAVRRASFGDHVFVLAPGEKPDDTRAKQRFVKVGPSVGQELIILDGLADGDRVAAAGSFKLRDGVKVVVGAPGGGPGGGAQGGPKDGSAAKPEEKPSATASQK